MEFYFYDKVLLSCYGEKKKIHFYASVVSCFALILLCLILKISDKSILPMKIVRLICWFFDQSEAKKNEGPECKDFHIGNNWPVNTEYDKIVFPLNTS